MKKAVTLVFFLILILSFKAVYADAEGYIVKFTDGFAVPESLKLEVINEKQNLYKSETDVFPENIKAHIEYCEPNEEISFDEPAAKGAQLLSVPEDEYYEDQWHLGLIKIESAFSIETYGNGIKVAVIDSGCSLHDDLKANLLPGKNYFTNTEDVSDEHGHGTHVCGVIGAEMNDIGICGAAPKAKIVPLKCFQNGTTTIDKVVAGIYDAVDTFDCDVINMSFGLPSDSSTLRQAINHADECGVIVVAAVGNAGGTTVYYPAGYDSVIGVASVGKGKVRSSFSQHNSSVLVCAPGEKVISASNAEADGYARMQGTSQATPFVAALAAIALSMDRSITPARFKELIINSCEDLGDIGYDTGYGYGLVDTEKLINNILKDIPFYVSPVNACDNGAYVYIKNCGEESADTDSVFMDYTGNSMNKINISSVSLEGGEGRLVRFEGTSGNEIRHLLWKNIRTMEALFEKRDLITE